MALLEARNYNLMQSGDPARPSGVRTTTNLFDVLRMQPIVGRTFTPDDEHSGALPVVVSERLWTERFGANPALVARRHAPARVVLVRRDTVGSADARRRCGGAADRDARRELRAGVAGGARRPYEGAAAD